MAVTGSDDSHEAEQLGGKNLGVQYDIAADEIIMSLKPSYHVGKSRAADVNREIVTLTQQDITSLLAGTRKLTRRNVLSMVMGVYDPLGLMLVVLKGKIMLRSLYTGDTSCSVFVPATHLVSRSSYIATR